MRPERRVRLALESLGDSADEVAESLRTLGIKGLPGKSESCPIAQYLSTLPGLRHVETTPGMTFFYARSRPRFKYVRRDCLHPRPVSNFIAGFDSYQYTDLYG